MLTRAKLQEVCTIFSGNSINAKEKESKYTNHSQGTPYIATKDVGFDGVIDYSNGVSIPLDFLDSFKKAPAGATLVCAEGGSAGRKISMTDREICFVNKLFALCPNQDLNKKYLFYYTMSESFQKQFKEGLSGLIGGVSLSKIKAFDISFPSLYEQQRIVAILDQAFADIEKARANAEKNLKNARELFDSYLNQISANKKPLGRYVTIKTGKLNSNAATENGAYPFFTCSRDIFSIDSFSFDCEAILLAGNNASGDFNVKHYCGKFDAYQRTYVITINEVNQLSYTYLYYQMIKSLRHLKSSSVGAGTKFLKIGMIENLEISVPSLAEQQRILGILEPLKENIEQLENSYKTKLKSLDELKKSLLQKAFSGELTKTEGHAA